MTQIVEHLLYGALRIAKVLGSDNDLLGKVENAFVEYFKTEGTQAGKNGQIFALAKSERRVLVTRDGGFANGQARIFTFISRLGDPVSTPRGVTH